jgi:hypothetical protein
MSPFSFKEGEHGRTSRQLIEPYETPLSPDTKTYIRVYSNPNDDNEADIVFPECSVKTEGIAPQHAHYPLRLYAATEIVVNYGSGRTTLIWEPSQEELKKRLDKEVDFQIFREKDLRYNPISERIQRHHEKIHPYGVPYTPTVSDAILLNTRWIISLVENYTCKPALSIVDSITGHWSKERAKIRQSLNKSSVTPDK